MTLDVIEINMLENNKKKSHGLIVLINDIEIEIKVDTRTEKNLIPVKISQKLRICKLNKSNIVIKFIKKTLL